MAGWAVAVNACRLRRVPSKHGSKGEPMKKRMTVLFAAGFATLAFAMDSTDSFASAKVAWERTKNDAKYQAYADEFAQFNNHFHIDEKDGCRALSRGSLNLMLVITHPKKSEYAVIERVFSDVDNAKTQCFKKSYGGIRTKVPPFVPFVLQMQMG